MLLLLSSTVDGLVLATPTKHRAATALRASSTSTWQTLRDLRQRALETVIGPEPDLPDAVEVAARCFVGLGSTRPSTVLLMLRSNVASMAAAPPRRAHNVMLSCRA